MEKQTHESVEFFKLSLIEMRKEMIKLLKEGKINIDDVNKIPDFFKLKEKDGFRIDMKNMSRSDIEQKIMSENKKIHIGHAIEAVRMMNIDIKDGFHYYNLLRKVAEDPRCQIETKRKVEY